MIVTVLGAQLGDEGKGNVIDLYGEPADVVVRYQGGDNHGHTVVVDGEEYEASQLPAGVARGAVSVIGNGCVVNLETLFDEIDSLQEQGLDPTVRVAKRAHVVLPYHRILDGATKDDDDVGTTGRGIGPTYGDKAARCGIRVGDLLDPETLRDRLEYAVPKNRATVEGFFGEETDEAFDVDRLFEIYREYGERLVEEGMPVDCGSYLQEHIDEGNEVMLQGAQGSALDMDYGTYPNVTSSNTSAGGACTGSGLSPSAIGKGEIIGVVKTYITRGANGRMPTELVGEGELASYIRDRGNEYVPKYTRDEGDEYGTIAGDPRRIGWLDMPMLRHADRVNGFTGIVVGHIDVLAGLDEIQVGHSYQIDGNETKTVPAANSEWDSCTVNYRQFEGWPDVDWSDVAQEGYEAIPENARTYLEYIETELDTPIYAVSVGPAREDTIILESPHE